MENMSPEEVIAMARKIAGRGNGLLSAKKRKENKTPKEFNEEMRKLSLKRWEKKRKETSKPAKNNIFI